MIQFREEMKKLDCRREAARRSMSLKFLLSHSRSFKVNWNYTVEQDLYSIVTVCCAISEIFSVE